MISIDGSLGEGGGQIVRTSIALSVLTGQSVEITNIRANRPKPGLKAQHLHSIHALRKLCRAEVDGLELGSETLFFKPNKPEGTHIKVDVGTAGSITLVLQALLLALAKTKKTVHLDITGGTDVAWSPPIDYTKNVFIPMIEKMGIRVGLRILKRGYYPKGGGRVECIIYPTEKIGPLNLDFFEKNKIKKIAGVSHAHEKLKKADVAERQMKSVRKPVFNSLNISPHIEIDYQNTLSYGSGITLWAESNSILGASSLGGKGKFAGVVGEEAVRDFLFLIENGSAVDPFLADQLIPYIALADGKSSYTTSRLTDHTKTNIEITERFLNRRFRIEEKDRVTISCI